jgi:hypothetical protein
MFICDTPEHIVREGSETKAKEEGKEAKRK